jgi:MFS family permease
MVYLRLLRVPHLRGLLIAMVLGRLPIGINPLALVLFIRHTRGDFGTAGLVAGCLALGSGLLAPLAGRAVDRFGLGLIVPIAGGHALGVIGLVVLAPSAVGVVVLCLVAFVAGALLPPVSSVLRVLYPELLRGNEDLLPAAFALDSVATDLIFAIGPLIVAVLLTFASAQAALIVSAVVVVGGSAAFAALVPARIRADRAAATADQPRGGAWRLGALGNPGIRVLAITMLPMGISAGALEVVIPAFCSDRGVPSASGILLAVWSIASAAGGFSYGILARGRPVVVHGVLVGVLAVATAPILLASSPLVLGVLLVVAGLPFGPIIATRNQLAGTLAQRGEETEAYTWVLTAMVAGIALGAATAGALIDASGWRAATAAAAGAALLGGLGTLLGHRSLNAALARA